MVKPNNKTERAKDGKRPKDRFVAQNRSASYNYHILEKLELAGCCMAPR